MMDFEKKIQKAIEKYRKEYGKYNTVFLRASESLDLSDRSIDYPNEHGYGYIDTKESLESLLKRENLENIAIPFRTRYKGREIWAIQYKGVHASEEYEGQVEMIHGLTDRLYIFQGRSLGKNLVGDGVIVNPLKILEILDSNGRSIKIKN